MEQKLNVIFIIVDALRAKNLSCYGYCKPTTPNIDDLAGRGILFEDSYSCSNATDPSLTTILSGRHPISHGIVHHGGACLAYAWKSLLEEEVHAYDENMVKSLPQILRLMGYTTMAVDWIGRWHRRGYDYYVGGLEESGHDLLHSLKLYVWKRLLSFPKSVHMFIKKMWKSSGLSWLKDARYTTDLAINLIRKNWKEKFFLFLHYWDTHAPYDPPERYAEMFREDVKGERLDAVLSRIKNPRFKKITERIHVPVGVKYVEEIMARYDGTIAFVDHEIGRLIQALEEWRILDECLILLTSDHGESITEHGVYFDHHGLYDETIEVPLILKYPESLRNKRIKGFVQHVDIVPTVLDLLGAHPEGCHFDGKSLLPLIDGEIKELHPAVYATEALAKWRIAVRTKEYKYIYSPSRKDAMCRLCDVVHTDVEELYDLNNDPGEDRNIMEEEPTAAKMMKHQLLMWIKETKQRRGEMKERVRTTKVKRGYVRFRDEEEIKARLERLGYI